MILRITDNDQRIKFKKDLDRLTQKGFKERKNNIGGSFEEVIPISRIIQLINDGAKVVGYVAWIYMDQIDLVQKVPSGLTGAYKDDNVTLKTYDEWSVKKKFGTNKVILSTVQNGAGLSGKDLLVLWEQPNVNIINKQQYKNLVRDNEF